MNMNIQIFHGNESTITRLIDGAPDLSAFTGLSLSIRQDAFNRGDWIEIVPSPIEPTTREIDTRRLQLALLELGLLEKVEAAVPTFGRAAQIEWNKATIVREDNPLAVALITQLNLDADEVFELANSIQ